MRPKRCDAKCGTRIQGETATDYSHSGGRHDLLSMARALREGGAGPWPPPVQRTRVFGRPPGRRTAGPPPSVDDRSRCLCAPDPRPNPALFGSRFTCAARARGRASQEMHPGAGSLGGTHAHQGGCLCRAHVRDACGSPSMIVRGTRCLPQFDTLCWTCSASFGSRHSASDWR
jgi:hypothetical protein